MQIEGVDRYDEFPPSERLMLKRSAGLESIAMTDAEAHVLEGPIPADPFPMGEPRRGSETAH